MPASPDSPDTAPGDSESKPSKVPTAEDRMAHPRGLFHFFSDHPKAGVALAMMSIAIAFSQKASPSMVWASLAVAWLLITLLIYEPTKGSKRKFWLHVVMGSIISASFLAAAGYWLNEPALLPVVFKNPGTTTWLDRYLIKREITYFNRYLSGLGFTLSNSVPPIGIGDAHMKGTFHIQGKTTQILLPDAMISVGSVAGASSLTLDRSAFRRMEAVRHAYAVLAFAELLYMHTPKVTAEDIRPRVGQIYANYYSSSYAERAPDTADPWVSAIWEIREQYGSEFADRCLFYSYKFLDEPNNTDKSTDFNRQFSEDFLRGVSVMEPDIGLGNPGESRTGRIQDILSKHHLLTDEAPTR